MANKKHRELGYKEHINIQGIDIIIPEPPNVTTIENYKATTSSQMFTPPDEKIVAEINYKLNNEDPLDADQEAFVREEWRRRREGYWFMNNGNLEYITGQHYFYISYWKMPVVVRGMKRLGLPSFVDSDRDYWYCWDAMVVDPKSFGMIYVTSRRDGKSYRSMSGMYNDITMTPESYGGMQSKTNSDASQLFKEKLIKPWQKLPEYFKPVDVGETHPSTALKFYEPSKRGSKNKHKSYQNVLRAEIDFQNVKEEAYDGYGLYRYVMDEAGKTIDSNVLNRWYIVKECFADGTNVTGKALVTTTVEEMEKKGGKNFKMLWEDSDHLNKNELGMTTSGLYRIFKPAYYGLRGKDERGVSFINKYGYSDQERSKAYLEKRREGLKGEALSSERRKYPFSVDDAFMVNSNDSVFDVDRIYDQKKFNENANNEPVRGNFSWSGGVQDSAVNWNPDPNGRWMVSWHPKAEDRNAQRSSTGHYYPTGTQIVAGVDPFDHRVTTDNKRSDAASYCFLKYSPWGGGNCFVSEYINRPATPELFYEDMIMQMVYYSGELLVENNKPGLINYFRQRGYLGYLMKRPEETMTKYSTKQQEVGIPMTGEAARDALVNGLVSYVYDHVGYNPEKDAYGNLPFERLLDDWLNFDVLKWTDYDPTVASGLAILASKKPKYKSQDITFIKDFHAKFDNKGGMSKRV
jgi:hypothetical protein